MWVDDTLALFDCGGKQSREEYFDKSEYSYEKDQT